MSNPFAGWTKEMLDAHNARVAKRSAKEVGETEKPIESGIPSVQRALLVQRVHNDTDDGSVITGGAISEKNTRIIDFTSRPNTDEEKLNKTERAYLWHLRKLNVPNLRIQQMILKLADDCRLTVDFTYVNANGRLVFVDVKGWQREDALIKMKFAARQFTEFDFVIVKRDGVGWEEMLVKP